MSNGIVKLITLALKELTSRQTGEHLKSILNSTLQESHIEKNQVYSITVDNGANMMRAVGLYVSDLENNTEDPFDRNETIEEVVSNISYEEMLLSSIAKWDFKEDSSLPVVIKIVRC